MVGMRRRCRSSSSSAKTSRELGPPFRYWVREGSPRCWGRRRDAGAAPPECNICLHASPIRLLLLHDERFPRRREDVRGACEGGSGLGSARLGSARWRLRPKCEKCDSGVKELTRPQRTPLQDYHGSYRTAHPTIFRMMAATTTTMTMTITTMTITTDHDTRTHAYHAHHIFQVCPDVDEYKMYYAQALYKAGLYPEVRSDPNPRPCTKQACTKRLGFRFEDRSWPPAAPHPLIDHAIQPTYTCRAGHACGGPSGQPTVLTANAYAAECDQVRGD